MNDVNFERLIIDALMNCADKLIPEDIFRKVGTKADELKTDAYVVGGFVRDIFLKRKSKDIDFVTIGSGITLAKAVAKELNGESSLSVFKNFGTAQVKFGSYELEFVGARKESYRNNSRKPIVEDGTLEDDQLRRDFTINAMAIQLNAASYGNLIDPFDGLKDLKAKIIKTPLAAEKTFSDDPLRMMRAIRLASQLNFDIDPETFEGIIQQADRIEIVSAERTTEELNKIILSKKPSYGFKLLYYSGLLKFIFPDLEELKGVEIIDNRAHKDNFFHTLQVLDNVADMSDNLWLRWAAILHDIAKPATKRFDEKSGWTFHGHEDKGARMVPSIFKMLKLPMNEKMKYVRKLVRLHLRPISLVNDNITDSALRRLLFEAGDAFDDLMILCKADVTTKNPEKAKRYLSNFEKVEKKIIEVEEKDHLKNFQPPIKGELIMETFQLKPSHLVGEIKEAIKEAILEGSISNNYEEAYDYMLKMGEEKGLVRKK